MHPVPIAAIAVLLLNDHWAKAAFHNAWTGKISDIAGMIFFPLMLQAMLELLDRREPFQPRRSVLIGCVAATALVFASTNLFDVAADIYRWGLGTLQWPFRAVWSGIQGTGVPGVAPVHLTQDPTDAWTAPFVLVALAVGWKRSTRGSDPG